MKYIIDAASDNRQLVDDCYYRLIAIAKAAYTMGNERLSDELTDMAVALREGARKISDAVGKDLHEYTVESQNSFNETIKTALDSCLPN